MKKQHKSSFKGKVISSAAKQKRMSYGYLNLPKDVRVFSLVENTRSCKMDFLPYVITDAKHPEKDEKEGIATVGSQWYRRPFKIHRNVGSTANETIVCPTSFGKKCPICEHLVKRIKEGADKEERSALRPKPRSLYTIIPFGMDKYEEIPHVWDMADSLFQDTLIDELKEDADNEDFFTLDNGKTANVRFKWESLGGHPYPEAKSISFSEREEAYDESILEQVPALDELLKEVSYTEIFNKFFDLEAEEDGGTLEEEEEEEKPEPRVKKHAKPEPEPEEEEEDEEEEEEEEEPVKPTARTRKPAPKPEPEEEEEEEEPAPKPVKKGGSTSSKDKCPYGHKFGIDTDKFKDCDTCEIWDDCSEEHDKKK